MDKRVLIVEDEPEMGGLLRDLVEADFEAQALVVPDGGQVLDLVPSFLPDVILLDLGLPDTNGVEVLHRLKEGGTTSHIPVIVVTGGPWGYDVTSRLAWEAGCDGLVHKLYNFHHLEPLLASYLGEPRTA